MSTSHTAEPEKSTLAGSACSRRSGKTPAERARRRVRFPSRNRRPKGGIASAECGWHHEVLKTNALVPYSMGGERLFLERSVRAVASSTDGPKRGRRKSRRAADQSPSRREAGRCEQARRDQQEASEPSRAARMDQSEDVGKAAGRLTRVRVGGKPGVASRQGVINKKRPSRREQHGWVCP